MPEPQLIIILNNIRPDLSIEFYEHQLDAPDLTKAKSGVGDEISSFVTHWLEFYIIIICLCLYIYFLPLNEGFVVVNKHIPILYRTLDITRT